MDYKVPWRKTPEPPVDKYTLPYAAPPQRTTQTAEQEIRLIMTQKPDKNTGARLLELSKEYTNSNANVKDKISLLGAVAEYCNKNNKLLKSAEDGVQALLAGQIRYLSQSDRSMSATKKIETLLDIPPSVALEAKVKNAIVLSYGEQTAYLNEMANDIWTAGGWARDYKLYSLAGSGIGGEIRYDPPPSELVTEQWANDQKRDDGMWPKGDTVPAGQLPATMKRMAINYFEAEVAAAKAMGKSGNYNIRIVAKKLEENASDALEDARKLPDNADGRRAAHKLLVQYYHEKLQPALGKIEQEKYFEQLYALAGDSPWKNALVFMHEHAQTGMLWSAVALGALNPMAGRMAFAVMGAKQVQSGVQSGNYGDIIMGGCMILGMVNTGVAGKAAGYTVLGGAAWGAASEISDDTGLTTRKLENILNNFVLIEGYFKARLETQKAPKGRKSPKKPVQKTEKTAQKNILETVPKKTGQETETAKAGEETGAKKGETPAEQKPVVEPKPIEQKPIEQQKPKLTEKQMEEQAILHDAKNAAVNCSDPVGGLLIFVDKFQPSAAQTVLKDGLNALRTNILKINDGFGELTKLTDAKQRDALAASLRKQVSDAQKQIEKVTAQVDDLLTSQPPQNAELAGDIDFFNTVLRKNSGGLTSALKELKALGESGVHKLDAGEFDIVEAASNYVNSAVKYYGKFAGQQLRVYEIGADGVRRQVDATDPFVSLDAYFDPYLLRRAVNNLCANAERYGNTKAWMEVEVTPTEVRIKVMDDGPGFSAQDAPKAFDYKSGIENYGKPGSSQVGLSTVKADVEKMGGSVAVSDGPQMSGKPTTVQITLKRKGPATSGGQQGAPATFGGQEGGRAGTGGPKGGPQSIKPEEQAKVQQKQNERRGPAGISVELNGAKTSHEAGLKVGQNYNIYQVCDALGIKDIASFEVALKDYLGNEAQFESLQFRSQGRSEVVFAIAGEDGAAVGYLKNADGVRVLDRQVNPIFKKLGFDVEFEAAYYGDLAIMKPIPKINLDAYLVQIYRNFDRPGSLENAKALFYEIGRQTYANFVFGIRDAHPANFRVRGSETSPIVQRIDAGTLGEEFRPRDIGKLFGRTASPDPEASIAFQALLENPQLEYEFFRGFGDVAARTNTLAKDAELAKIGGQKMTMGWKEVWLKITDLGAKYEAANPADPLPSMLKYGPNEMELIGLPR